MRRELRKLKDSLSEAAANISALSPGLQTKTMREQAGRVRDLLQGQIQRVQSLLDRMSCAGKDFAEAEQQIAKEG